jgi:hypothetical protein
MFRMRNKVKFITAGIVMAIAISLGSVAAYAANAQSGSAGALADNSLTLEDMLTYAIQDEYTARAEYSAIVDAFGAQAPYTNILKAEEKHITRLTQLFDTYGYTLPVDDATAQVPDSLEASHASEVTLEENNIAMYEKFLQESLPADVKTVFEQLKKASENHLNAFQNAVDGNLSYCNGTGYMMGRQGSSSGVCQNNGSCPMYGNGNSNGTNGGNGQGNRGGMCGGRN